MPEDSKESMSRFHNKRSSGQTAASSSLLSKIQLGRMLHIQSSSKDMTDTLENFLNQQAQENAKYLLEYD